LFLRQVLGTQTLKYSLFINKFATEECYFLRMEACSAKLNSLPYSCILSKVSLFSEKRVFAVIETSSVPRTKIACLCSSLLRCTWKGEIPSSLYFVKSQSNLFSSQYFFNRANNICRCISSSFFMFIRCTYIALLGVPP